MARTRQLSDLELDTRRLADLENATGRFPQAEVWEYINKGLAYVYRQMIVVQDRPFFNKDWTIVAGSGVSIYALAPDFLQLLSVSVASSSSGPWCPLEPYEEPERANLLSASSLGCYRPSKYGITGAVGAYTQGTIPTAYSLEILPPPSGTANILVRYIPSPPRLINATDTFDGILGFEDAACTWAAILMRRKDDLPTEELERDMERHLGEIRVIAKRRDRSRPPKVQLVRRGGGHPSRRFGRF